MKLFKVCFFLYPHGTTMYSNTLKAAKAIKSNQIKLEINSPNPKLRHTLSQGNRMAWLFLISLKICQGSFNLWAFLIWFTNPKGRKDHLLWPPKGKSTILLPFSYFYHIDLQSWQSKEIQQVFFYRLSLQLLLELSVPLTFKFSLNRFWNSCSTILPWTDVKLNQPSVTRDIPFIFVKYRKYSWQPSNFLEFPISQDLL